MVGSACKMNGGKLVMQLETDVGSELPLRPHSASPTQAWQLSKLHVLATDFTPPYQRQKLSEMERLLKAFN